MESNCRKELYPCERSYQVYIDYAVCVCVCVCACACVCVCVCDIMLEPCVRGIIGGFWVSRQRSDRKDS